MRVFIGSSGEQKKLVEWLTSFMRSDYPGKLEPVPWTMPWPGGRFTLENLLNFVEDTDASILFWTPDDKTWYRDTERHEPRDNLVFEAGLFLSAHGRTRTQIFVPKYQPTDSRKGTAIPSDLGGFTWNAFQWVDGPAEATGLPVVARGVCDLLATLGPRPRRTTALPALATHHSVDELKTFVGDWSTISTNGLRLLAARPSVQRIDILANYRGGDVRRELDHFRTRSGAELRACFANMWDDELLAIYRRKFTDREPEHIRNALKESIQHLVGPCKIEVHSPTRIEVSEASQPPNAKYEVRLTSQRITYSYYRVDDVAFLVPLDMRRAQNPAPLAWVIERSVSSRVFDWYATEYDRLFSEAQLVYRSRA